MTLLTYDDLAQVLELPRSTLYTLVHRGQIPFIRISKRIVRFDEEAIRNWLETKVNEQAGKSRHGVTNEK